AGSDKCNRVQEAGGWADTHKTMLSGFQDQGTPGFTLLTSPPRALGRAAGVDNPIESGGRGRGASHFRMDARLFGDAQLFAVVSELMHVETIGLQYLGDQQTELSIAQDGHL